MAGIKGIQLTFNRKVQSGTDALGDPIYKTETISVDNCLIAPISEPANAREQQAMTAGKMQVRIHLPKSFTGDISNSTVVWDKHTYQVDQQGDKLMDENTPGPWNKYFRAEVING